MKQYKVLSFFVDGSPTWNDALAELLACQSADGWTLDHIADLGIDGLVLGIFSRGEIITSQPVQVTIKDHAAFKVPVKVVDGGAK